MQLNPESNQKVYFASDFHLGVNAKLSSLGREKLIIQWLDECKKDAHTIFLVGDLFDFWFEYRRTIPKGFSRFQGKLAEIADAGINLVIFTGNHDLWMFGYFEEEIGAKIIYDPIELKIDDTKIFIGHGDGVGPGDSGYRFLKKIFTNQFFQWCFHRLHPNFGIGIANYWSQRSRAQANNTEQTFQGDKEWLWAFTKETEKTTHFDYYIFGHRHLPLELEAGPNSKYINLGEWLYSQTYAVYENGKIELKTYAN